jgi:hypothetical protein
VNVKGFERENLLPEIFTGPVRIAFLICDRSDQKGITIAIIKIKKMAAGIKKIWLNNLPRKEQNRAANRKM